MKQEKIFGQDLVKILPKLDKFFLANTDIKNAYSDDFWRMKETECFLYELHQIAKKLQAEPEST